MEHLVTSIENYVINYIQTRFTGKQETIKNVKSTRNSQTHENNADYDYESRPIEVTQSGNKKAFQQKMKNIGSYGETESDSEFSSTEEYSNSLNSFKKKSFRKRRKPLEKEELIFGIDLV